MKLTKEESRIEEAHLILQKLEDQIVGYMTIQSTNPEVINNRLESLRQEVLKAIHQLNEEYDLPTQAPCEHHTKWYSTCYDCNPSNVD